MRKRVFISYDHSEDVNYKNMLRAWDANTSFEFEFDQRSPDLPIKSDRAEVVKATLTKKMKESDYLFVIVGEKTHRSDWVRWEIERAKSADVKLKLAAVKLGQSYLTPEGLLKSGTEFATSFTQERIIEALLRAKNTGY